MKKRFIKISNLLLGGLVSMLGFSSCSNDDPAEDRVEYGQPHAKYRVVGTVTDEIGNPIDNIKVKVGLHEEWQQGEALKIYDHGIDSTYTDKAGKFITKDFIDVSLGENLKVFLSDEDGAANGAYKNDTLTLKNYPNKQYEKAERWYVGAFEYTVNAKLKKDTE